MSNRYAYLGPEGTFTEAALRALKPDTPAAEFVPCNGVDMVFAAVRRGEAAGGVVPLENSVEGGVSATTAELVSGDPLLITAEITVPVEFTLFARAGTTLSDVKRVATHSHALAQCRGWLAANLPDAESYVVSSTAAAAQAVADPASMYDAAICARIAGERYGLVPLAEGVGDRADAATRFIYLSRPGALPEPTGADRTSIAAVLDDEVGALSELLSELSLRGINVSRIESRPTKDRLGTYRFFLDFDGHVADARVGDALTGLRRRCSEVRFLGSYPKADRSTSAVRPSASEQAFRASAHWLTEVRAGRLA